MEEVTTVGLDLAKLVFQAHGADASGRVVFRKTLRRSKVLEFFGRLPPASSPWRPARARTTGAVSSPSSGTPSGSSRPPTSNPL